MIIEDLKKRFDSKAASDIENDALNFRQAATVNRREFILTLYYLKSTNRFQEISGYEKYTFERYIRERFALSLPSFERERFAYISNPDHAEKLGVGLIAKIKETCGAHNVDTVASEIEASTKKTPAEIDKIIGKHAKPERREKPQKQPYIPPKRQKGIAEYLAEEAETKGRIARLLETVNNQKVVIETLRAQKAELEAENERLKNVINNFMSTYRTFVAMNRFSGAKAVNIPLESARFMGNHASANA
jgi:hypothetical protein